MGNWYVSDINSTTDHAVDVWNTMRQTETEKANQNIRAQLAPKPAVPSKNKMKRARERLEVSEKVYNK